MTLICMDAQRYKRRCVAPFKIVLIKVQQSPSVRCHTRHEFPTPQLPELKLRPHSVRVTSDTRRRVGHVSPQLQQLSLSRAERADWCTMQRVQLQAHCTGPSADAPHVHRSPDSRPVPHVPRPVQIEVRPSAATAVLSGGHMEYQLPLHLFGPVTRGGHMGYRLPLQLSPPAAAEDVCCSNITISGRFSFSFEVQTQGW